MTEYQFNLEIERLKQSYGDRPYSVPRTRLLWEIVKGIDADFFSKWVDRMLLDSKYAPGGPEFRELYDSWQAVQRRRANPNERLCAVCGDEGRLLAIKKDDWTKTAFLCTFCDAAKSEGLNKNLAKPGEPDFFNAWWSPDKERDYVLKPVGLYKPEEILFD